MKPGTGYVSASCQSNALSEFGAGPPCTHTVIERSRVQALHTLKRYHTETPVSIPISRQPRLLIFLATW